MRLLFALTLLLGGWSLYGAEDPKMISVMEQSGVAYVGAPELERVAHIAVKKLQDNDAVAVCSGERCAMVKDFVRKDGKIWVNAAALAKALAMSAHFSADRSSVNFVVEPREDADASSPARVGQLAPNFRVARLDGGTVSLADFRGKRVLINSWASW
jgi:hypothetical protein